MTILESLKVVAESIRNWANGKFLNKDSYVIDSALSTESENPVQNKVVNTEIENLRKSKVDVDQGLDNANKILSVGDDGIVVPTANIVYVGPTAPTDPNIKVWINTAEEGTGVTPVLPRLSTIHLAADSWSGSAEPYSQPVTIATATTASKVDLQPTAQQIVSLQNEEISLMIENNGGIFTCYALGHKPTVDYTMQVLVQEVAYV